MSGESPGCKRLEDGREGVASSKELHALSAITKRNNAAYFWESKLLTRPSFVFSKKRYKADNACGKADVGLGGYAKLHIVSIAAASAFPPRLSKKKMTAAMMRTMKEMVNMEI